MPRARLGHLVHLVHVVHVVLTLLLASGCALRPDPYRLATDFDPWRDPPLDAGEGLVHAVIEIPSGTTAKWEATKDGSGLSWEQRDGRPRVVRYLGYPGSYGMIPRTLLPEDEGGDGDPLDVIVLGDALARAAVVAVRVIGVLKLLDGAETDDKLIAVAPDTPLGHIMSLEQLDREFPDATRILELWFTRYKGPGEVRSLGFADAPEAQRVLDTAARAYTARVP